VTCTIQSDWTVDVNGDVNMYNMKLTKLPFEFWKVNGNFDCYYNQLTTLDGAPKSKSIGRGHHFNNNKLTSIKGAP
jgi:hypothetical protein